jgi:hypothetical protein
MTDTTAIALFAFNRPDLLSRTLAALCAERVPVIHAFSDGPRRPADEAQVSDVRRILRSVDWADVTVIERADNLGLGRSILAGVTDVLRRYESTIVVEDDLVCSKGTYAWMTAALRHYRADPRVMTVSAWTHPRVTPPHLDGAPFFCGRVATLFWGISASAWDGMLAMTAAEMLADVAAAGRDPARYGSDIGAMAAVEQERNIWAVRLIAHQMRRGGLCLQPAQSLVRHIGYDSRATNAARADSWDAEAAPSVEVPAVWPEPIEHPDVAALWQRATREDDARAAAGARPGLLRRMLRAVARLVRSGAAS